jgi:hypothetical protein
MLKLSRNFCLFSLFTATLIACNSSVEEHESLKNNTKLNKKEQADSNRIEYFELPKYHFSYMEGTIGEIPIVLVCIKNKKSIEGYYYYEKIGTPLKIQGNYNNKNDISFVESSDNYDSTGFFKGYFTDESTFIGTWNNPKRTKEYPVKLIRKDIGIEQLSYQLLSKENCDRKVKNKYKAPEELEHWDTICSLVEINYMKLKATNPSVNSSIQEAIEREVCASYGERKKSITDVLNMVDPDPNYDSDIDDYGFDLHVNCKLVHVDPFILSIAVSDYFYTYGAAHPNSGRTHLNFDLSTGKLLQLTDLFSEKNIQKLSVLGEKKFIAQYGSEWWDFEPGNFKLARNFSLTAKGITFHYNTYEIGSYANGAPSFFIPYTEIKKLMKPL